MFGEIPRNLTGWHGGTMVSSKGRTDAHNFDNIRIGVDGYYVYVLDLDGSL